MEPQVPLTMDPDDSLNRYSMPVTRSKTGLYDMGLDQTNTARFLFGEDETTPKDSPFGHGSAADENFPTLVRQDNQMVCTFFCAPTYLLDISISAISLVHSCRLVRFFLWITSCSGESPGPVLKWDGFGAIVSLARFGLPSPVAHQLPTCWCTETTGSLKHEKEKLHITLLSLPSLCGIPNLVVLLLS